MELYLSIGANMGDRKANIQGAVEQLDAVLGAHLRLSSFFKSKSWGFEGNDFLNVAVCYETSLSALEILHLCKDIEQRMGRTISAPRYDAEGKRIYSNRPIDIDIILYGDLRIDTHELTIPHPRMHERDFVMVPLKEVLPLFQGKIE